MEDSYFWQSNDQKEILSNSLAFPDFGEKLKLHDLFGQFPDFSETL